MIYSGENLNCNLHELPPIISQTNRSERIKGLSKACYADLSDFVPKLPSQCAAGSICDARKGKLLMNVANEEGGEVS